MDLYFGLAAFVAVVGLVLLLVGVGKVQDVGRCMFIAGLTAALIRAGGHAALHISG